MRKVVEVVLVEQHFVESVRYLYAIEIIVTFHVDFALASKATWMIRFFAIFSAKVLFKYVLLPIFKFKTQWPCIDLNLFWR